MRTRAPTIYRSTATKERFICGRYAFFGPIRFPPRAQATPAVMDSLSALPDFARYNIAPTATVPVLIGADPTMHFMRWGLVPDWSNARSGRFATFNARVETLAQKPTFSAAWRAGRRCVVPASGWFEWRKSDRQAFYFSAADASNPLFFAGIWEAANQHFPTPSFSILTQVAGSSLSQIHDRQPILLPLDTLSTWLSADRRSIEQILQPCDLPVVCWPVSSRIGGVQYDDPSLVTAIQPEPRQTGSLF